MSGSHCILALTPGDPGGIGPEVVARAARDFRTSGVKLVLYGPASAWQDQAPISSPLERVELPEPSYARASLHAPSAWGGCVAMGSLEAAVRDAMAGKVDAVITGPVSKQSMRLAGYAYPGQTEYLAALTASRDWAMMLAHGCHRVLLATRHLPLRDVPRAVLADELVRLFLLATRELSVLLGRRPRIIVCGLNPHAGDGGLLGDEERKVIGPAVVEAAGRGCLIQGPVSAEEAFMRWGRHADVVVAMYHDQGALPVKLRGLGDAVNVTLGLPIVRTSPGHGTAFDLAGTGRASERSVSAAMRWALALARRRRA